MDPQEAEERFDRVVTNLVTTADLLRDHDREHWAHWMDKSRRMIEARDARGLEYLLRAYGGMGSFNDVAFHELNGDRLPLDEIARLNRDLSTLRSQMYSDAKDLLHDLRRLE